MNSVSKIQRAFAARRAPISISIPNLGPDPIDFRTEVTVNSRGAPNAIPFCDTSVLGLDTSLQGLREPPGSL
jgi:hypothetical protein